MNVHWNSTKKARIAIRVNPDVDAKTHPYISTGLKENKFGVPVKTAKEDYIYANSLKGIDVVGIHCHIGSQLTEVTPFRDAADILINLIRDLRKAKINIKYLDLGGGLGISYKDEITPSHADYASALCEILKGEDMTSSLNPAEILQATQGH